MNTEYLESEKIWRSPGLKITYSGLGQAILAKLNDDDPDRILEVDASSGIGSTVESILEETVNVAQNLLRLGVKKGDVVILYTLLNRKVTPITFACYTIGAPINFFETKFEGDEIDYAIKLLDPTVIIYEEEYRPQLSAALKGLSLPRLKHVLKMDSEVDFLFKSSPGWDTFQAPDIGDPTLVAATLMLTSGSTGFPKVIQHSHAMMMQGLYTWWGCEPRNVILCSSPLRWISQVSLMMQPVFFGVMRVYTMVPPMGDFGLKLVKTYGVTHFFSVPGVYLCMLRSADELKDFSSLSSLKTALVGGEVVSEPLVEFSAKVAPQCRVVKCYGMTELAGGIASDEPIDKPVNGGALKNGLMVKIIDDNGRPLGPNQLGRLCLKSTLPFLGYLRNPEADKETFLEDGWCNTGDYGFMDSENLLNIVTRYKNLLRSGSTVVIPNSVENVVSSHPSVLTSVLVGHPDPESPPDEVGTVFVTLRRNDQTHEVEEEIKQFTMDKLTKEQLRVVRYFRVIPEMPLTSCGKIDRIALKERAKRECRNKIS